jgi:hypothetical protein
MRKEIRRKPSAKREGYLIFQDLRSSCRAGEVYHELTELCGSRPSAYVPLGRSSVDRTCSTPRRQRIPAFPGVRIMGESSMHARTSMEDRRGRRAGASALQASGIDGRPAIPWRGRAIPSAHRPGRTSGTGRGARSGEKSPSRSSRKSPGGI